MPVPNPGSLAVNNCKDRCKGFLSNPRPKMPKSKSFQVARCHWGGSHLCSHRAGGSWPSATNGPAEPVAAPASPACTSPMRQY